MCVNEKCLIQWVAYSYHVGSKCDNFVFLMQKKVSFEL